MHGTTPQLASRFLLQSTFGPTRALLDGALGADMGDSSVRSWIDEQMSLPATSLRAYARRVTNPRIRQDLISGTSMAGRPRPACAAGSRWHRFAFNSEDARQQVIRVTSQPDGKLVVSSGGEVRTELLLPNYTIVTAGKCGVFTEYITSRTECFAAAQSLGFVWNRNVHEARDDNTQSSTSRPRGCYMTTNYGPSETMARYLWTNVYDSNRRTCSETKICICKRALNATSSTVLSPPPPPTPPPAPPLFPGVSDPMQCTSSQCCVVIYETTPGAQCNPVPIWDFTNWVHPGGGQVSASALCGTVRYGWLAKNGNHGGDARPEDITATQFAGGATRAGTYVDPTCSAPNTTTAGVTASHSMDFKVCYVEESVGGLVKMVRHDPSITLNDNQSPCSGTFLSSTADWYVLYNPPISFSTPDPAISQSFSGSEASLSPLTFGNGPSDAYLLDAMPPACTLNALGSAYVNVGGTWYRHDRRLELNNCTGACLLSGRVAHPYTLTNASFGGIDRTRTELANEPALGHHLNVWLNNEAGFRTYMPFFHSRDDAKMMTWTSVVLGAADQLRHRVAFALSQILVVGEDGLNKQEEYEVYTGYYDVFVRNAFGSYYDVLREVAYHPVMATYLTFHNNRAFASRGTMPDENFAREVMQLFSIGLYALDDDGTIMVDSAGESIATYDNSDIMNFARVWTGFTRQPTRPNVMRGKRNYENYVDSNGVNPGDRDRFPKVNLYDQHIGDGHPLCSDLPSRGFLRAGARYRLTLAFQETLAPWFAEANDPSIVLGANSNLAHALCGTASQPGGAPIFGDGVSSSTRCTIADEVVLSDNMPCDGDECLIFVDVYKVQLTVGSPTSNVSYSYEYIRPPCVELTFHEPMRRVRSPTMGPSAISNRADCVEDTPEVYAALQGTWTYYTSMCKSRLLVSPSDGWVGFHTSERWIPGIDWRGTVNYFPVRWRDGLWPTPENGCSAGNATDCVVQGTGCYCDSVAVSTLAAFTDASIVPTALEVEATLFIGAPKPGDFGGQVYSLCTTAACSAAWPAVRVHVHSNTSSGQFDARTIFEIAVNGTAAFFANKIANVDLGGFTLRNPPHFMSFRNPLERDMMYETEALLHHLMWHRNTAPFIAYRLIQRMVTSNPSPRYTKVVAEAFRTGMYDGVRYGEYSSLAAVVHALLLDREARSSTLDLDPSHGQLREPLLRVVHIMRAMEYTSYDGRDPELTEMMQKIGQQVFQSPGVFNFYKPEYQALGAVLNSNLVAPEFEINYAPTILGYLNGVTSLVRYGLTSCSGGFGLYQRLQMRTGGRTGRECTSPSRTTLWPSVDGHSLDEVPLKGAVDGTSSDGVLSFSPQSATMDAGEVVSELALLLTGGRLSDVSRRVIEGEYVRRRDNYSYFFADEEGNNCTAWGGEVITTVEECEAAARTLPVADTTAQVGSWNWKPAGCFYENTNTGNLRLNSAGTRRTTCTGFNKCVCQARGESHALKRAIELMLATPDFAVTNLAQPSDTPRVAAPRPVSGGRTYKAIIVLFWDGGADSWNMLVPHSGCTPGNVSANYDSYQRLRGGVVEGVALPFADLLPINVQDPSQPCSTFGIHPRLTLLQRLYNEGDAAFLTNVGTLVEPMTKAQYLAKQGQRPPSLFAHNVQQKVTQSMHPQDKVAKGVLGRIIDALNRGGSGGAASYRTGTYSLDGMKKMLEGERAPVVLDKSGVVSFAHQAELQEALSGLTLGGNRSYKSIFGESWADALQDSLSTSQTLGAATSSVSLTTSFPTDTLGKRFEQVARVIAARAALQEERQVFFVPLGGWDTHSSLKDSVDNNFRNMNSALTAFETEMKAQNAWQNTILMTVSDFGRTYAPNGAGTVRAASHSPIGLHIMLCHAHT